MRNRASEIDVRHAITTHLGLSVTSTPHFSQTTPLVLEALVLAAQAFIVFDRAKDLGTEKPSRSGLNVR